jgi:hypothetical protein
MGMRLNGANAGEHTSKTYKHTMQCKNHPNASAVDRCAGCAEPFCPDCLVEVHGQKYCGSCKVMALQGQPIVVEEPTIPCKEANEALTCAIISMICPGLIGLILAGIALSKSSKAKQIIEADPRMLGAGKVKAARIISIVVLIIWGLGTLAYVVKSMR